MLESIPDLLPDVLWRQDSFSTGYYKSKYGTDGYTWGNGFTSNSSGTDEAMQSSRALGNSLTWLAIEFTNPIYGRSTNVTPLSLKTTWCIRY